jgi:aminoglycoside/choline kinase family phosphotransferase
MNFFIRHFLGGYRGASLAPDDRRAIDAALDEIVAELAAEPRVLCHRDYHSRNLMFANDRLYVIDFQDARMGPNTYDLVSLLRDSYVDLPDALVEQLIQEFHAASGSAESRSAFRARFDLMALQRNLKALGTFGYQTTVRGNPVYIQYIPRTLRYVRDNLRGQNRFAGLRTVLSRYVAELAD